MKAALIKKSYGSDKYIQISLVVTYLHIWHTFKILNAFLQGTMHNIQKLYQHYVQFNFIQYQQKLGRIC